MALDNIYMENLDEYINDESRVVTYKWLSRTLGAHVNQAKQMLYNFIEHERTKKRKTQLNVTYFVAGTVEDKDNHCQAHMAQVVPEEMLDITKSQYLHVTSCHVYSVQTGSIQNSDVLFAEDYNLLKEQVYLSNKFSAIQCTLANVRSAEDTQHLQSSSVRKETKDAPQTKPNQRGQRGATVAKKPTGIAGMFAAAKQKEGKDKKQTEKTDNSNVRGQQDKTQAKTKGKQAGVTSFFGKQAGKDKAKSSSADMGLQEHSKDTTPQQSTAAPGKRGKNKKGQDGESEGSVKKRRRIQAVSSSDSSGEDHKEMETDEEKAPSPAPSPAPVVAETEDAATSQQTSPAVGKRRKKRKLVSKTSVNEEGYMVTEKVWQEDSTDESEAEEVVPPTPPVQKKSTEKPSKKSPGKKTSPARGSKQMSLTSFFKKK